MLKKFRVEFRLPPFGLAKVGVHGAIQIEAEREEDTQRIAQWMLHPSASIESAQEL